MNLNPIQLFDAESSTYTYILSGPGDNEAVIIDPVDHHWERDLGHLERLNLKLAYILETHAHADHLSAAGYLQDVLGAPVAIGRGIVQVQERFKTLFGLGDDFPADGRQFDRLLDEGDTLRIGVKVVEGDRTRIQNFEGVCIARANKGLGSSFTVRKISFGEGVERVFPLYSPNIDSIEVVRRGAVRRAKLYYLRGRTGKAARIAERRDLRPEKAAAETAAPKTEPAEG